MQAVEMKYWLLGYVVANAVPVERSFPAHVEALKARLERSQAGVEVERLPRLAVHSASDPGKPACTGVVHREVFGDP